MTSLRTMVLRAACALLAGLAANSVPAATDTPLPGVLEPWRAWALHGSDAACPVRDGDELMAHCRWPGPLRIDVAADGARFSQQWTLQDEARVPLPGDARWRAVDVTVDGRAAPVVAHAGRDTLALAAGSHRIEGRIAWTRRPATLPLPDEIALVELRIDGVVVARPERNAEGALVLGAVDADDSDALQIEVHRLLADGVPQRLATRVDFSVSGRPREQVFPPLLPPGFAPVGLDGDIPARLEADGRLRVQLRSGRWSLVLLARAQQPLERFTLADGGDAWPAQEIWQYRSDPAFRTTQLLGLPGVDPSQVTIPDWNTTSASQLAGWQRMLGEAATLPAFLFERGSEATLEIALRGLPAQRPPRLSLQRELWLDFDGDAFSATDRIVGELGGAARLDLRAPWSMQRADAAGEPLLITAGSTPGHSGVELRGTRVALEVDARVERAGIAHASGWEQPFDQAAATLHLPPGYRLLAARGADRAGGSWWQAWSLLDLFLLSVTALVAWRLGGGPMFALAAAWGVLGWHEPDAPRISVLVLLLFALLAQALAATRIGGVLRALRGVSLAIAALFALGFAATQLRLALYPQLEQGGVDGSGYYAGGEGFAGGVPQAPMPASAPVAQEEMAQNQAPMARAPMKQQQNVELDSISVSGSRMKAAKLFNYPADAVVQNGAARPNWRWHRHELGWNGPLLPDDELGLLVSPPTVTRVWRVASVVLLGLLLWRLARARPRVPGAPAATPSPAPAAAALLLPLLFAALPPARAQALPDEALVEQLRERLLARDEACRPECAALAATVVDAASGTLRLSLDAQAQAEVAWPLPRPDASLVLVSTRVDGAEAGVLRDGDGDWVHLARGVHRIELQYAPQGERWRIAFPLSPATLEVRAAGFEQVGVDDDGRLVGDTLELVPPRDAAVREDGAEAPALAETVPAFVRVERHLMLDLRWQMQVTVRRVAPLRSGINVALPLLPGEQPFQDAPPVRDGHAIVSLPAGVDEVTWLSRLQPAPEYALRAGDGRGYAEEWWLSVSPLLHAEAIGVPEAGQENGGGVARRFLPLPGETLSLAVSRPEAVRGERVAIENVQLVVTPGQRARDSTLSFDLRASQAGQHALTLPGDAELLALRIDGVEQPRVLDGRTLRLPLRPAVQRVVVEWREAVALGLRSATPELALGASASNIALELRAAPERWLLATQGPRVGPAVLIWGELLVMALAAWMLARRGGTPLRFHQWLLLGLGFSSLSWFAAVLVAGWLLLLAWRGRNPQLAQRRVFPWLQLALFGLTAFALLALVVAVPFGLLGQPDMHIAGNGSSAYALRWFADRSDDGVLPHGVAWSVPLWIYKLAILAWSLWLANALIGWLRWAWSALTRGGAWAPLFGGREAVAAPAPPAA